MASHFKCHDLLQAVRNLELIDDAVSKGRTLFIGLLKAFKIFLPWPCKLARNKLEAYGVISFPNNRPISSAIAMTLSSVRRLPTI